MISNHPRMDRFVAARAQMQAMRRPVRRPLRVRLVGFAVYRILPRLPQRWREPVRRGLVRWLPPPLAVLGMSKTGTSTLQATLFTQYSYDVGYGHVFERVTTYRRKFSRDGVPTRVVVPVREPVGRAVSGFFFFQQHRNREQFEAAQKGSPQRIVDWFLEWRHPIFPYRADEVDGWFGQHVERTMGVDVYAEPFGERGWRTYRGADGRYELLVLKIELPDRDKLEALRGFTGNRRLRLLNTNSSDEQPYREFYRRFKAEARLPHDYLERMLGGRYARHFYSAEEREAIYRRWCDEGRE